MTTERVDPTDYYTKPLETWTFRELHDALGTDRVAAVLGISPGNVRVQRYRRAANMDRMKALQAAVRADETNVRADLVTFYTNNAARRRG